MAYIEVSFLQDEVNNKITIQKKTSSGKVDFVQSLNEVSPVAAIVRGLNALFPNQIKAIELKENENS